MVRLKFGISKKEREGIPTYRCTAKKDEGVGGILNFECPYCLTEHTHGLATAAPREVSHRSAHCINRDYHPRGYFIYYV